MTEKKISNPLEICSKGGLHDWQPIWEFNDYNGYHFIDQICTKCGEEK